MAATASNCVVDYNGPLGASGKCYWQWRSSSECGAAFEYMKDQLGCTRGSGSGCSYNIAGCGGYFPFMKRCNDIGGVKAGIFQIPTDGKCE
ncbi:hypothetical protein G6F56_003470 [Rhizopus delemar]|uniref:Uncharacterized protein n=1 Tax=Rhizopus stolonifer TaxID=4846 RepID=A0A367J1L2_RHIST|nr:hypothetical protein G6F56_003470 [Rhizopus delemar]RCH83822.1 hypothetical protein CU098_007362 [Rhizopus stolonifer]